MLVKKYAKVVLPVAVLAGFYIAAQVVKSNPPQARRGAPSMAPQLNVDVQTLKRESYAVTIDSYGTVKPRTQSILLPQVSGQIVNISTKFREGGFFEAGDVLVEIDDRDLKAEVKIAQANLFSSKQALSEEQARVEQALQDWKRLGNGDTPPDLVLRKPQLLAAEAKVYSAQASLDKAELAVERSKIVAPFTGRILSKDVDVGQVVSPSTQLAEIYAVDYVEIRLPLKNKDLPYMLLPESTRFENESVQEQPLATFTSNLVQNQHWFGKVVRTEGAYDQNSQQLFVVAQINDPYGKESKQGMPLKIGQYVKAKINGRVVESALVIPNKAIYQGSYVYIVEDDVLKRTEITIDWQNEQVAMVATGLTQGQLLVLTPLGQVTSGTPVAINEQDGRLVAKKPAKRRSSQAGGKNAKASDGEKRRKKPNENGKGDQS